MDNEDGERIVLHFDYLPDDVNNVNKVKNDNENGKFSTVSVLLTEHDKIQLKDKIDKLKAQIFDSLKA